jgi:glycosyltransferase involved in cell wall biosynthesis
MAKIINELSVFFPAYNEEKNIVNVTKKTKKVLQKVASKWEIIIVNDGSKDKTKEVAERLRKKDKRIRVISHEKNQGYGGALKTGYKTAKYEWVAFIDSDDQFDFSEISKLIKHKDKADLILGIRKERADPFMRRVYTLVWSRIFPIILFRLNVKDYSCGFWMIKKEVYDDIRPIKSEEKVTKIEMLVKAKRKGYKFAEVEVNHYPRTTGSQTGADIKVITRSVVDLIKLWFQLR